MMRASCGPSGFPRGPDQFHQLLDDVVARWVNLRARETPCCAPAQLTVFQCSLVLARDSSLPLSFAAFSALNFNLKSRCDTSLKFSPQHWWSRSHLSPGQFYGHIKRRVTQEHPIAFVALQQPESR